MDSSFNDIYINEANIPGEKPEISSEQKKELLKKGETSLLITASPSTIFSNNNFHNYSIINPNPSTFFNNNKFTN